MRGRHFGLGAAIPASQLEAPFSERLFSPAWLGEWFGEALADILRSLHEGIIAAKEARERV
jgi:hypothetical protein